MSKFNILTVIIKKLSFKMKEQQKDSKEMAKKGKIFDLEYMYKKGRKIITDNSSLPFHF